MGRQKTNNEKASDDLPFGSSDITILHELRRKDDIHSKYFERQRKKLFMKLPNLLQYLSFLSDSFKSKRN